MQRQEVFEKVSFLLTDYLRLQPGEVEETSHVVNDLGADSLALVELGFKFMEAFHIGMLNPEGDYLIIGKLVDHIAGMLPV
jgi:acyl carrier protein